MAKLPLLQKLLKRGKKQEELVVIFNYCTRGNNFVLLVRKNEAEDEELINSVVRHFVSRMESDDLDSFVKILLRKDIQIIQTFTLEGINFWVFGREL